MPAPLGTRRPAGFFCVRVRMSGAPGLERRPAKVTPPAWNADLWSARAVLRTAHGVTLTRPMGLFSRRGATNGTFPDPRRLRRGVVRRPRAFGPLCRPEVGVPSRTRHPCRGTPRRDGSHLSAWGNVVRGPSARCADRRSAFQAVRVTPAVELHAETGATFPRGVTSSAGLRPAVPTGGRRSKPYASLGHSARPPPFPRSAPPRSACGLAVRKAHPLLAAVQLGPYSSVWSA